MTTFVDITTAVSFSDPAWAFTASDVGTTLAAGDVLVVALFANSFVTWDYSSVPGDWTEMSSQDWGTGPYPRFKVFAKVWGGGDDQSSYTAEWTVPAGTLSDKAQNALLAVGEGSATAGISSLETGVDMSVVTSFPYSGSSVAFEAVTATTNPRDIAQVDLMAGSSSVYLAAVTNGLGSGWAFSPAPVLPDLDMAFPEGVLETFIAAYSGVVPPEGDIRISGNTRRFRRLAVS